MILFLINLLVFFSIYIVAFFLALLTLNRQVVILLFGGKNIGVSLII